MSRIMDKLMREIARLRSDWYVRYLRRKGCKVGMGTKFHGRKNVDLTRPHLIKIGDNVTITDDVTILTHGHDWSVLRNAYRDPMIIGSSGRVEIGNNVFVGTRAVITKGVVIGDNSIVAAGSVVTGDIPPFTVAAGVPARPLRSLREHYLIRKKEVINECTAYARELYCKNGGFAEEDFGEFFQLFKRRAETLSRYQIAQLGMSLERYGKTRPVWDGLEALLEMVRDER